MNETMTYEEQEAARAVQLAEVGTGPDCPMCGRPRCERSDYLRCLACGVNWCPGEDVTKPASMSRPDYLRTKAKQMGRLAQKSGTPDTCEKTDTGATPAKL